MSVFDKIFGRATPTQAPTPPAQPPVGNNPAQNPPVPQGATPLNTDPNGVIPQGAEKPADPPSPLAKYEKLWETPAPSKDDSQQQPTGLTPQQMMEAASKVDFSRVVDQESLQKIVAGGEDAAKALVGLLNKTAQTVYGQSTVVASKLIEQQLAEAEQRFASKVPDYVRRSAARDSLVSENPAFKNPAVSGIVEMVQRQFAQKFPNASASELKAMAQEYMSSAAQAFGPQQQSGDTSKKKSPDDIDWDNWLRTPTPNLEDRF